MATKADLNVSDPGSWACTRPSMRVAMVTARYLPEMGGTEIHTYESAKRLGQLGADVTVITTASRPRRAREEVNPAGIPVIKVRAWPKRSDLFFAPGLLRALRSVRPDLVHVQGFHTLVAPLTMLASRRLGVRYVVTLHSGGHSSRLRTALRPLQTRLLRPLLAGAVTLVAGSRFEAVQFARWLGLPLDRITVLPSGVDLPLPHDFEAGPRQHRLILSVGRLENYKGHQAAIRALPELRRRYPDVRLRIAGRGSYEAQLRRLAERLGVADLVEIAPVPSGRRDDMARLLVRADVVVSFSSYESQGIAMQEALALGRPLVVSDVGALAELPAHENVRLVSRNAGSGEIVEAVSAMLDAAEVAAPEMPTWDGCAAGLLDIYRHALVPRP